MAQQRLQENCSTLIPICPNQCFIKVIKGEKNQYRTSITFEKKEYFISNVHLHKIEILESLRKFYHNLFKSEELQLTELKFCIC